MRNLTLVKILVLTAVVAVTGCKSASTDSSAAEGTAAAAEGTAAAAEGTAAAAEGTAAAAEGTAAAAEGTAAAAEGTAAATAGSGAAVGSANAPSTFPGPVSAEMLHGTWNVDFMRSLQSAEMTEEERAMAMALMGSMQMSITFDAAGTMTMNAQMMGETRTEGGSYRVTNVGTNTLTIETTTPGEGSGAPAEVEAGTITFDSATAARIQPGDEQPLFINRAN